MQLYLIDKKTDCHGVILYCTHRRSAPNAVSLQGLALVGGIGFIPVMLVLLTKHQETLSCASRMQENRLAAGALPRPYCGSLQRSPRWRGGCCALDPTVGAYSTPPIGEEAGTPSPRTPSQLSAFQASGSGPLGLTADQLWPAHFSDASAIYVYSSAASDKI